MFTWKPLYAEIAQKLLEFQDDRQVLVKLMMRLDGQGLRVSRYMDKDAEGNEVPLEEIDPVHVLREFQPRHQARESPGDPSGA